MQRNDAERHQDVAERHERHDDLCEVSDTLDAAEDDDAEYGNDDDGGCELRIGDVAETGLQHTVAAKREFGRIADRVRLDRGQQ